MVAQPPAPPGLIPGTVWKIANRVWGLPDPDEWHPGILLEQPSVARLPVRLVLCSGKEPNEAEVPLTHLISGAPFNKPTYVYLNHRRAVDPDTLTAKTFHSVIQANDLVTIQTQIQILTITGRIR